MVRDDEGERDCEEGAAVVAFASSAAAFASSADAFRLGTLG